MYIFVKIPRIRSAGVNNKKYQKYLCRQSLYCFDNSARKFNIVQLESFLIPPTETKYYQSSENEQNFVRTIGMVIYLSITKKSPAQ